MHTQEQSANLCSNARAYMQIGANGFKSCNTLQHTSRSATHCNTLQNTETHNVDSHCVCVCVCWVWVWGPSAPPSHPLHSPLSLFLCLVLSLSLSVSFSLSASPSLLPSPSLSQVDMYSSQGTAPQQANQAAIYQVEIQKSSTVGSLLNLLWKNRCAAEF